MKELFHREVVNCALDVLTLLQIKHFIIFGLRQLLMT